MQKSLLIVVVISMLGICSCSNKNCYCTVDEYVDGILVNSTSEIYTVKTQFPVSTAEGFCQNHNSGTSYVPDSIGQDFITSDCHL